MKRYSEKSFDPNASDINHEAYGEGVTQYKLGHFGKAAASFKLALEYWPLDPQAWFALGDCYDEINKPIKAEKCFRKALKYTTSDKKADIYFNLGNSLYDQKKLVEAIECYEKITGLDKIYQSTQKNLILTKNELSSKNT